MNKVNVKNSKPARQIVVLLAVALVVLSASVAGAVEYVDIDQPTGLGGTSTGTTIIRQQTFTPNANNITAVSVFLYAGTGTITIQVLDMVCGTVLTQGTATGSGWVKCDMAGTEALVPGNLYAFDLLGVGSVPYTIDVGGNPYAGGELTQDCGPFNGGLGDMKFKTWAETNPVEVESANWSRVKALYR